MQLIIVQKIINLTQNVSDQQKYQLLYEALKKQTNKQRKTQKKYSRKGKPTSINTSNINTHGHHHNQQLR